MKFEGLLRWKFIRLLFSEVLLVSVSEVHITVATHPAFFNNSLYNWQKKIRYILCFSPVLLTPRDLLPTYLTNFGPGLIPQSLFVYPAMGPNQMFLQVAFPHETRTTKLTGNL